MLLTSTRIWRLLVLQLCTSALLVEAHFTITYPEPRGYDYHSQFKFPCKFDSALLAWGMGDG